MAVVRNVLWNQCILGWFILKKWLNEQHNDANITVIYCSCFTVNSHYKAVFTRPTVRNLVGDKLDYEIIARL